MQDIRPALARMLEGRMPGRAVFAPLSSGEVFEVAVGMPVGLAAVVEGTAYVRPLVAAIDEGRPAGVIVDDGPSLRLLGMADGRHGGGRHVPVVRPAENAPCEGTRPRGANGRTRAGLDPGRRRRRRPARAHPGEVGNAPGRRGVGVHTLGRGRRPARPRDRAERRAERGAAPVRVEAGRAGHRRRAERSGRRARAGQDALGARSATGEAPPHRCRARPPLVAGPAAPLRTAGPAATRPRI